MLRPNNDNPASGKSVAQMAFDRKRGLMYIIEKGAYQVMNEVIHVFQLSGNSPDNGDIQVSKEQSLEFDQGEDGDLPFVHRGDIISYNITTRNEFTEAVTLIISDALSTFVDYIAGTFKVNGKYIADTYFSSDDVLTYQADLNGEQSLMLSYDVLVRDDAVLGSTIENIAMVSAFFDGSFDPIISNKLSNLTYVKVKNSVPEPSTLIFFGIGLLGIAFFTKRLQKKK